MKITKKQPPAVYTLKLNHADLYGLYQEMLFLQKPDGARRHRLEALFNALREQTRDEATIQRAQRTDT